MSAPAAARTGPEAAFDPDRGWRLHHQVAVRPEPFGALLYHFGTRKLSFLKNRIIVEIVNSLADHPDAADPRQLARLILHGIATEPTEDTTC